MTYNVLSGTLSLYTTTLNHFISKVVHDKVFVYVKL